MPRRRLGNKVWLLPKVSQVLDIFKTQGSSNNFCEASLISACRMLTTGCKLLHPWEFNLQPSSIIVVCHHLDYQGFVVEVLQNEIAMRGRHHCQLVVVEEHIWARVGGGRESYILLGKRLMEKIVKGQEIINFFNQCKRVKKL